MGEVYRARDTRLERDVAIKVLPAAFVEDHDRLARFEREAKLLAQLNHPNIAAIHGLEESDGVRALVMELVEGPTLAERLEKGPLPLDESLSLARQIAEGLEEAHEKGIIHRDLKPQNIKVSIERRIKILDFGLAKAMDPARPMSAEELAQSPTLTFGGTREGVILGTAAFMAPEQARGGAVDKRVDIWSFGVVLYEMLSGSAPFAAATVPDTLVAVLTREIDWSRLPATTPVAIRRLLRRCLERDPRNRLHDIADARLVLSDVERGTIDEGPFQPATSTGMGRRGRLAWALVVAAVLAGSVVIALFARSGSGATSAESTPRVASLTPLTVDPGYEGEGSLAPDGESIVYAADRGGQFDIYLQQIGVGSPINLTSHPADDVQPSISPDGRLVAFVSTRESRLQLVYRGPGYPLLGGDIWVMPVLGGPPRKIVEDGNFPSWSPDGRTIYFARGLDYRSEIRRVAVTGGESTAIPIQLPVAERPVFLFSPQISPDGRWLLFSAAELFYLAPIGGGPATVLGNGRFATWEPSGDAIVFCSSEPGQNGGLWWLPFAASSGEAVPPARPLMVGPAELERPAFAARGRRLVVTAVERSANLESLAIDAEAGTAGEAPKSLTAGRNDINFANLSPDARSIVYTAVRGSAAHLWRLDEGREPVQLTDDPAYLESYPRWSPDGKLIAFARRAANTPRLAANAELWVMAPDGAGPRRLTHDGGYMAWLPDARRLLYFHVGEFFLFDVLTNASARIEVDGPEAMAIFAVSPDGQWFVYQSAERGNVDLALAPVAGGRARWLVQTDRQDHHPIFTSSGKWLYFQPDHRNLWRIPGPSQGWRAAPPEQVTHYPESGLFLEEPQLSADGRRLVYSRIRTAGDLWTIELGDATAVSPAAGESSRLGV